MHIFIVFDWHCFIFGQAALSFHVDVGFIEILICVPRAASTGSGGRIERKPNLGKKHPLKYIFK